MVDINLLLGRPIPIKLRDGTYNKKIFDGFYLRNYKLKDFLTPDVGYEQYMYWCSIIVTRPKDIADILWVKYKTYYKDMNDWLFIMSYCYDFNEHKPIEDNDLFKALNFMLGDEYVFSPVLNLKALEENKLSEDMLYINVYSHDGRWLAKIDKDNFERITNVVKLTNFIKPSELSKWNYAYESHEKRALKNYYKKRENEKNTAPYVLNLETVLRFLKLETGVSYEEWLNESLYEIYSCYNMKASTFQTLALHIGLYGGNVKIDSNIRNSLVFGAIHQVENIENLAKGNNLDSIQVQK